MAVSGVSDEFSNPLPHTFFEQYKLEEVLLEYNVYCKGKILVHSNVFHFFISSHMCAQDEDPRPEVNF